jgi:hypothetical protein
VASHTCSVTRYLKPARETCGGPRSPWDWRSRHQTTAFRTALSPAPLVMRPTPTPIISPPETGCRVTIRGRTLDGRVEIEVEDPGSGILPEHVPHIFKRLYRIEQSRNAEWGGSGLGLAIARSATAAHS